MKNLGKWFTDTLSDHNCVKEMHEQATAWMKRADGSGMPGKYKAWCLIPAWHATEVAVATASVCCTYDSSGGNGEDDQPVPAALAGDPETCDRGYKVTKAR